MSSTTEFKLKEIDGVKYRTIDGNSLYCKNCIGNTNLELCGGLGFSCLDYDIVWIKFVTEEKY